MEGNNTVYGTHAVPPVSKKAYKDRTPLGGKLHPGGRRKRSGTVACGAAVLFVGLALVLSIAALVLFVFIHRGILPLPGAWNAMQHFYLPSMRCVWIQLNSHTIQSF